MTIDQLLNPSTLSDIRDAIKRCREKSTPDPHNERFHMYQIHRAFFMVVERDLCNLIPPNIKEQGDHWIGEENPRELFDKLCKEIGKIPDETFRTLYEYNCLTHFK